MLQMRQKPNGNNGISATADSLTIVGNVISNNNNYAVSIKNSSIITNNTIVNNVAGGIYVVGTKNLISKNIVTNTTIIVKAINLHASITPIGNLNKQPAIFKSYRRALSGGIIIRGMSVANDTVEIFL